MKFDLIINDWMMPKMSELYFLQRVHEHDTKVLFLMLTIMNSKGHVATAAESGVTA
jgi:DNA-binding response OmpR family regulator